MVKNIDFITARKEFTEYLQAKRRARATIIAYNKDIEQLTTFVTDLGKTTFDLITKDELEAFTNKLNSDNYTAKSVSRKINSIKTFYRYLKSNGYIETDPSSELEHPKYEIKPPRIFSKIEYRALRDACRGDIRMYAIVELFLQTGIRIGELAALELIDLKNNEFIVRQREGNPERTVPLNKPAKEALDKYLETRSKDNGDSKALFITKSGKPLLIRNIRTAIDRYFRVAGIENAKVNDLRHTFIAHHLMAGTPITIVSKLVGHKRLSTTEKYLELIKDKQSDKMKLEEL